MTYALEIVAPIDEDKEETAKVGLQRESDGAVVLLLNGLILLRLSVDGYIHVFARHCEESVYSDEIEEWVV